MKELTHQVQKVIDKIVDFPLKTMENRKPWNLKKKNKQKLYLSRILYPTNLSFKNVEKIKASQILKKGR